MTEQCVFFFVIIIIISFIWFTRPDLLKVKMVFFLLNEKKIVAITIVDNCMQLISVALHHFAEWSATPHLMNLSQLYDLNDNNMPFYGISWWISSDFLI